MDDASGAAQKLRAATFSVFVNVLLLSTKIIVGVASGSLGMLAEAAHSLLDLLASGFAYTGIRSANRPFDEEHPYGHEKFENFSSLVQTALLGVTSIWIFYEAGLRLLTGFAIQIDSTLYYAIAIMVFAIIADFSVSRYLFQNARKYGSSALEADAYHFSTDIYSSAAVLLGLVAAKFGYAVVDPLAAIFVAIIMLTTSIRLGRKTTRVLVDAAPPKEITSKIRDVITDNRDITAFHDLRARQAGSSIFVDVSIHVGPNLSLGDAHNIANKLEKEIQTRVPNVKEVIIHIEPETSTRETT
ncbi:MAG: cation diffusion facilitator family transporter [Halobacteriota archaeon]|jgi:cation diffusion facilitator family transporter